MMACAVCHRDSDVVVLVQNSYDEWLCLDCNEWVFHMTIDDHRYITEEDSGIYAGGVPWLRPGYVPAFAESL